MSLNKVQEIERTIDAQNQWRSHCINLIASENVVSGRVRKALGSDFGHRYAEGHPGARYYEGTKYIDELEAHVQASVKEIFGCEQADVRAYSGNVANEAVFSRIVKADRPVMVNSTPGGGHISHHKLGSVGKFSKNIVDLPRDESKAGYAMDVPKAVEMIEEIKPAAVILGKSMILLPEPVAELADVCRKHDVFLHYDAAHVFGLIAGGQFQKPLDEGALIMSGSTHKTFFGTQRGVICSNLSDEDFRRFDRGVFPGSTSNHHLDTLASMAIVVEEFKAFGKDYAKAVIDNAKHLAHALKAEGMDVQGEMFGFTESHQVIVSVKEQGGGKDVSRKMNDNNIVCNMNMLPHEPRKNATNPEGLRLGVQEMTRFGMGEAEMKTIAKLIADCVMRDKNVKGDVEAFRNDFQVVKYSFDEGA
ncbi:MAG: serine hydroxymethyltransferase [Deltaproteobacteria bacterium]|nr:serine hydroxymethyltransferase [Deltaproteobacteria bacterium]MCB9487273.1 serine hydroxymethyltransferase [Deltaproteobacteria bacterium]